MGGISNRCPANLLRCFSAAVQQHRRGLTNHTWHASAPFKSDGRSHIAASEAVGGWAFDRIFCCPRSSISASFSMASVASLNNQLASKKPWRLIRLLRACSTRALQSLQHGGACCVSHLQWLPVAASHRLGLFADTTFNSNVVQTVLLR